MPSCYVNSEDARLIAESICQPWSPVASRYFTYWAWYSPDKAAWAKKARWIRCDALILMNDTEPYVFQKWIGKRLDIK